jgi:hypothetical protein
MRLAAGVGGGAALSGNDSVIWAGDVDAVAAEIERLLAEL